MPKIQSTILIFSLTKVRYKSEVGTSKLSDEEKINKLSHKGVVLDFRFSRNNCKSYKMLKNFHTLNVYTILWYFKVIVLEKTNCNSNTLHFIILTSRHSRKLLKMLIWVICIHRRKHYPSVKISHLRI